MEAFSSFTPSFTPCSQLIEITMETWLLDRRPGPYLCLCLCFMGQPELSVRQDSQTVGGTPRGGGEDVGGWTRDGWASAVSSVHLHTAQCPGSTVLNDKSPASPSSQTGTPLQTPLHAQPVHAFWGRHHANTHCMYTGKHAQEARTEHIHRQAYSSPAFCIGDTFHYSKLLSGDVVCTSRGDIHSL